MAKSIGDTLASMRNNPRDVRFGDATKIAQAYFGPARRHGSHHVFRMPWPGDPRVNLQESSGGKAKVYQVRQLLMAIDRLETVSTKENDVDAKPSSRDKSNRRGKADRSN
jgi:hypothetical protein